MKIYLNYGLVMAAAGAALAITLYLLGFHSDPEKLTTAQTLGAVGGVVIAATCITLGTLARRALVPPTEEFGYGRAFGAGVAIAAYSALFGIVTTYAYAKFINPEFVDVIVQSQMARLEERGLSASQLEAAEKTVRTMSGPGVQAFFGFFGGILFGTLISLVTAAFLRRRAVTESFVVPPAAG